MSPSRRSSDAGDPGHGPTRLAELTLQLVTFVFEEVRRGRGVDVAARAFARHRRRLLGGLLGGVGAAGGAWAALTAWTSSLGVWGTVGLSLGLLSTPAWVPLAGGLAGLGAASAGLAGGRSLTRMRSRRRHLQSIIGLSREVAGVEGSQDEGLLRGFLRFRGVPRDQARDLMATTPQQARRAARRLCAEDRWDVARCIYPIVYQGEGIVTDAARRRFTRVCEALELPSTAPRTISRDYRERLEGQWAALRRMVARLNWFAEAMVFDLRELEMARELVARLSKFDPRRRCEDLRQDLLAQLGRGPDGDAPLEDAGDEAALVTAYALAQTVLDGDGSRRRLGDVFDGYVDSRPELSPTDARRLRDSRRRVDRVYRERYAPAADDDEDGDFDSDEPAVDDPDGPGDAS